MKDVKEIISKRLRKLRDSKGWRIREAADHIGVGATAYGNWEQGIRAPRYAEVEKAAVVYGVSPEYLVGWSDKSFKLLTNQDFVCPGKLSIDIAGKTVDVRSPSLDSALSTEYLNEFDLDNSKLMNIYAPDDAMKGDIQKGDEVLINRSDTVPDYTNIFAIMVRGNIWLRRIRPEADGSYTMEANDKAIQPDTKVNLDDINIVGRVIRVSRNL